VQHVTNADNEFRASIIGCLRALANDTTLDLPQDDIVDTHINDQGHRLTVDTKNSNQISQVSLIRGLSDSLAMMHLFHDTAIHQSLAPKDRVADRLFTLLEKQRFEAVGCRQYAGVAQNLACAWVLGHSENALSRFGGEEQLEFVLSCLVREQLLAQPLPPVIFKYLTPVRGPVEDLVRDQLAVLPGCVNQQVEFAQCVLQVIETLGFDVTPNSASMLDTAAEPDTECTPCTDDVEEHDVTEDDVFELRPAETAEHSVVNEDAEPEQALAIVRNVEHEWASEAEYPDIKNIVDTAPVANHAQLDEPTSHYRVFNKTQDEECAAVQLATTLALQQFRQKLDQHIRQVEPLILPLANRLQRVLLSRQKSEWVHDMDEGELDPKRLTRIIAGPLSPLAYRERASDFIRDTTVTLLIDNSRSMSGTPILTAAASADLIARVLERCGVPAEVLGFTTVSMYGGQVAESWRAAGCPQNVGRINALRHIVYKSANQSWRQSRMNFGLMLNPDILNQNIDGEALLWAVNRLRSRHESRQILFVLTDGRPSDSSTRKANSKNLLSNHLKQVVHLIEKRRTPQIIGIWS